MPSKISFNKNTSITSTSKHSIQFPIELQLSNAL